MALPACRMSAENHHGRGWRAMLRMARYLEEHPHERHVVFSHDPLTDAVRECELHDPADVRLMVKHLRKQAEIFRDRERAGLS